MNGVMNEASLPPLAYYRPSSYYFRRALRAAANKEEAIEVGLIAVDELEQLKAWVRTLGLRPPKVFVLAEEAEEKSLQVQV